MSALARRWLGWIAMIVIPGMTHAEETQFRPLASVLVDATYYTAFASPGWSSSSCPGINFVYVLRSDAGSNQMLATLLAAKTSGLEVQAIGTCVDGVFHATRIWVQ